MTFILLILIYVIAVIVYAVKTIDQSESVYSVLGSAIWLNLSWMKWIIPAIIVIELSDWIDVSILETIFFIILEVGIYAFGLMVFAFRTSELDLTRGDDGFLKKAGEHIHKYSPGWGLNVRDFE